MSEAYVGRISHSVGGRAGIVADANSNVYRALFIRKTENFIAVSEALI